jgi:hypothetical protein
MSIYPNPSSDILYINTQNGAKFDGAVLFDISGRVVRKYNGATSGSISVSGFEKGIYLLQVFSGKNTQTQKIIIE